MHIEVLTEGSSNTTLLEHLLPKLIGPNGEAHSWRIHDYRTTGHIPPGMKGGDPRKRILLDRLPSQLRGYAKTPGIDAVVVVLGADDRDCVAFLTELRDLAAICGAADLTMFRLAIEELEAWYFGDRAALLSAYPQASTQVLKSYQQDSICGTWELLADAVDTGGAAAIRRRWSLSGQIKHEWANRIGPHMNPDVTQSPGFGKLRDGLRRLVQRPARDAGDALQPV
jgi:hypothetical protein